MQKSDWKKCKLGDVAQFKTGKLNSNAAVSNGRYLFFTCAPQPLKIDSYAYDQQAILLAGNNADGNFAIHYYEGKFNAYQRTYIINTLDNNSHLKYLYYALSQCLSDFKLLSQGTSTKFLTAVILNNFEINLPPVEEQKRIADILGAFDDKIELLQKQNKTLEDMANAIFKSWFVNFDVVKAKQRGDSTADIMREYHLTEELYDLFPSSFEGSSLGPIPTGWEVKPLGTFFPIRTGKKDANVASKEGAYPFFSCAQNVLWTNEYSFDETALLLAGNGDFNLKWYRGKFEAYQRTYVLIPNEKQDLPFLYYAMQFFLDKITLGSRGSVIKFITKGMIENYKLVVPEMHLWKSTGLLLGQWLDKIEMNNKEIQTLTELRDSLLPRLISGKIRV